MAGLPVVSTDVGQCREVLDDGTAGLLVPPSNSSLLASALINLLRDAPLRAHLGQTLQRRVHTVYDSSALIERVCGAYNHLLQGARK
jgi:glycosyltransferase involved in cell wall biosynthesis